MRTRTSRVGNGAGWGGEATAALGRERYQRGAAAGYRNGTRSRRLLGSFGPVEITVPRVRLSAAEGTSREWRSAVLPRCARMTKHAEALITAAYLAGTNTRRVKRALAVQGRGWQGRGESRVAQGEDRLGSLEAA